MKSKIEQYKIIKEAEQNKEKEKEKEKEKNIKKRRTQQK